MSQKKKCICCLDICELGEWNVAETSPVDGAQETQAVRLS